VALAVGVLPLPAHAQPSADDTRLVFLGTKGGPSVRSVAQVPSSTALVIGKDVYVIDAGYGVTYRLAEKKIELPAIRAVFITHHHSDHNLELGTLLYNAWANSATRVIEVHGPDGIEPLVRASMESNKFDIETRMADEGRPDPRKLVAVHTYREGLVLENSQVRVTALRNLHPPIKESYALKFEIKGGKTVVFSGDTAYLPALAEFARDCDYLVHEVMYGPALDRIIQMNPSAKTLMDHLRASHTLAEDVGRIAAQAKARHLVLTHFVPGGNFSVSDEEWKRAVRTGYAGDIIIARDLLDVPMK
jgi:ribonuclease BN (tRNA processing enzyme)